MKYVYPAVIHEIENYKNWKYAVRFPDLPGCFTEEKTIPAAIEMAEDAAAMWLTAVEDDGNPIPVPTMNYKSDNERDIVTFIAVDTNEYRKENDNRAVKKTLTIPNWLNRQAEKAGVNFSQILQEALKKHLKIA
jgi:predicted RNase H-like HicB family nuclease